MMRKIFKHFMKMPYYENCAAASGAVHNIAKHEDAVEDVLRKHGFTKVKDHVTKGFRKIRDAWMKDPSLCTMKDGTYISQPCGTNDSPDFIVKCAGKVYFLECKSAKGGTPMFNSGVPKSEYLYIFCSKKHNETTMFWGGDVLSLKQQRLIEEHIHQARKQDEILNSKLGRNLYGLCFYTRPMIQHKGGRKFNDYFLNPERNIIEQRVLDAL